MQLHRTTGKPDWANLRKIDQNNWQKIATSTKGLVTPGNIVTVLGLTAVLLGLVGISRNQYLLGGVALAFGRFCDLADGWIAEKTKTKSPLGELLDASIDKIATVLTLVIFYYADVAAGWLLLVLALPHLIITALTFLNLSRGRSLHPSRWGKLSMALAWLSLLGLIVVRSRHLADTNFVAIAVYALVISSVCIGFYAAFGYGKETK